MNIFNISFFISLLLTSGVYLTGHIDKRQYNKFGFYGARFLILMYSLVYGFINAVILIYFYSKYIHGDFGIISIVYFIFSVLVVIGIVHTDTEHSLIEYFYDISPLKKIFLDLELKEK